MEIIYEQTIDFAKIVNNLYLVPIKHEFLREIKEKIKRTHNPKSGIRVTASCFFRSRMWAYTCVVVTFLCPNNFERV